MLKDKVDDTELNEFGANDRHDQMISALQDIASSAKDSEAPDRHNELVSVLKAISEKPVPEIDKLLSKLVDELAGIEKNRTEEVSAIVQKVADGIAELKAILGTKPKAFTIERDDRGIKRIIPEY